MIGVFTEGKPIPYIDSYFDEKLTFYPEKHKTKISRVIGFGPKQEKLAKRFANSNNIPFLHIDDGLLQNIRMDSREKDYPFSLAIDDINNIHDGAKASRLEMILSDSSCFNCALLDEAKKVIKSIQQYYQKDQGIDLIQRDQVVLIDQSKNDPSIQSGLASLNTFRMMYETAKIDHPHKQITIYSLGSMSGYLAEIVDQKDVVFITEKEMSLAKLLKGNSHVYTVTSSLAIQALILNKPVRCFGLPFYAGWGVTEDDIVCERRTVTRTFEELFAGIYLLYSKYIHPKTGMPGTIVDVIEYLNNLDSQHKKVFCFGIQPWKRGFIRPFVESKGTEVYFPTSVLEAKTLGINKESGILVFGHKESKEVTELSHKLGSKIMRIEDGFIRSVGLGVYATKPWSLTLDRLGIYYNPQKESELERILNSENFTPLMREQAFNIIEKLVNNQLTKYNSEPIQTLYINTFGKKVILVPGQVENDFSILYGCQDVRTNADLLIEVRKKNPEAYIIYKPHPDVVSKLRQGEVSTELQEKAYDYIETEASIISCIEICDELHTMTSLTGFDALLRGKKVFTYGSPFYSGWGLTVDRHAIDRRTRRLSLEELVAGTLLVYPIYYDWDNKRLISCDIVIDKLITKRERFFSRPKLMRKIRIPLRVKKIGYLIQEIIHER